MEVFLSVCVCMLKSAVTHKNRILPSLPHQDTHKKIPHYRIWHLPLSWLCYYALGNMLMKQKNIWSTWEGCCVRSYYEVHRHFPEFSKNETIICTQKKTFVGASREQNIRGAKRRKEKLTLWNTAGSLRLMKKAGECSVGAFHKVCQGKKRGDQPTRRPKVPTSVRTKYKIINLLHKEGLAAHYCRQGVCQRSPETSSQFSLW